MKRILYALFALILVLSVSAAAFAEDGTSSLTDARTAYVAARQSSELTDYQAQLQAMVVAGSLTQEQADLLLTAATEANALRAGTCPSCGYQFQIGTGRAAHKHGKSLLMQRGARRSSGDSTTEASPLEEAQSAYASAKSGVRSAAYEAELAAMVESGALTQEQADLLLTEAKEEEALANGTCPSCGYVFQTSVGTNSGRGTGFRGEGKSTHGRGGRR